ncbi:MAG: DEAD/DEAH box helicase family protein [Chloroflexota bacterium]|nr:DEAD/DEAH box helicase family protein [Chloroflexota bacterium]
MRSFALSKHQLALIERPIAHGLFLTGPAGTGKTTAAVGWLLHLLESGVSGGSILVIVPQRTLASPYYEALRQSSVRAGGQVTVLTVGGLAQRTVDLFWPLVAEDAGFGQPDEPPTFLTLETAQYYMARLVRPLLDQGYFETITINRNRIYSQIIDNLNKAAVVGFPYTQIGKRLKAAWSGEQSQHRIYDEAQACATRFRQYCLAHNLLDFSLQLEVFFEYLWAMPLCRNYLLETYPHLIVDNVEEDTPVAHDLLRDHLPHCRSALLIYDQGAGYRRFLGADPEGGRALRDLCDEQIVFTESYITSPDLHAFGDQLARSLNRPKSPLPGAGRGGGRGPGDAREALAYEPHRYYPEMLDWVADEIAGLVHGQSVPPGEIVVLAPFLPGALRFSLMNRLEGRDVPVRSHRPSRALRDEPATQCLLTLAAIAHPEWGICPSPFDVAYALMQAVDGLDLVRAQLLTRIVYRSVEGRPTLTPFDQIIPEMKERLTFVLGERYERLHAWMEGYIATSSGEGVEFDFFLGRLFGEVLSQAGFGFHHNYDAGKVAANLIESVQKFRWVTQPSRRLGDAGSETDSAQDASSTGSSSAATCGRVALGQEYIEMVQDGVIAAQYIHSWQLQPEDAVLLAPAYTFLMSNRPVDYQFWLDVGSRGWWERLYQPLTQPYVLNRGWPRDAIWTDADEHAARQETLFRLTQGLILCCRRKVYLGLSELGERGLEQKGQLLRVIQRVLRRF